MTSTAPVRLLVTPRMSAAFLRCKQQIDAEHRDEAFRSLQSVFHATAGAQVQTIDMQQLRDLSRLYRSTLPSAAAAGAAAEPVAVAAAASADAAATPADADADATAASPAVAAITASTDVDDDSPGSGWVHELVRGSSVAPPLVKAARPRDPAFLAFLEQQRWKQERREYHALVKDLPGNKVSPDVSVEGQAGFAGASRDLGHGINILTLMVTGFIVFYSVGRGLFPHNEVLPVLCGLLGLVGALLVEVSLFLVREQKAEIEYSQQAKMARAARKAREAFDLHQIKTGKIDKEMMRRQKVIESQKAEMDAAALAAPEDATVATTAAATQSSEEKMD